MEILPELKKSFKILSNIPDKKEELLKSFDKLGVNYNKDTVTLLSLLSVAFNEKWVDTINRPVSPKHRKYLMLKAQIPKAQRIASFKKQREEIEEVRQWIASTEAGRKAMADMKAIYEKTKEINKKIEENVDGDVCVVLVLCFVLLCKLRCAVPIVMSYNMYTTNRMLH